MAVRGAALAPVRGRARIEVLDILRGIAILGIFYMNIPYMGNNGTLEDYDMRRIGWSAADRNTWATIAVFWEGTQRGLLEFLFGAGTLVLTAKAMQPDGPVAVADLFYRRNLWLFAFGLIDIFLLTWVGDILHIYALAALFIFPFRTLSPRWLIPLGLLYASAVGAGFIGSNGGVINYIERSEMSATVQVAQAKQGAHKPLDKAETAALAAWQKKLDHFRTVDEESSKLAREEDAAHRGGPGAYMQWAWATWYAVFYADEGSFHGVMEAVCGMFLGMAFWKMGIIQGQRSPTFYALLALGAYGVGMVARGVGVAEVFQFAPQPKTIWITREFARLAVSLGHLALINLAVQFRVGKIVLAPFRAAGQTAFSIYVLTSILGLWVMFAPWGLNMWGRYAWAELALIATIVNVILLVAANLWLRYFVSGPIEWLWRSLAYWQRQPFRRGAGQPAAPAAPGTEVNPPLPA